MQKQALLALLISLELITLLASIYILPINIKEIHSPQEITLFEPNQKITFEGRLIKETKNQIVFDNNISIYYPHNSTLINKSFKVNAIIDTFYENKTISIKSISPK